MLKKTEELLWVLRSGQAAIAPYQVESLKDILQGGRLLENYPKLLQDQEAVTEDTPWVPVVDTVLQSAQELLKQLGAETHWQGVLKALRLLVESGMPDRALATAREWCIATAMAKNMEPGKYHVGGESGEQLNA